TPAIDLSFSPIVNVDDAIIDDSWSGGKARMDGGPAPGLWACQNLFAALPCPLAAATTRPAGEQHAHAALSAPHRPAVVPSEQRFEERAQLLDARLLDTRPKVED